MTRAEELKEKYDLEKHPEGGWFSESYTSPFDLGQGPSWGASISFLMVMIYHIFIR